MYTLSLSLSLPLSPRGLVHFWTFRYDFSLTAKEEGKKKSPTMETWLYQKQETP